MTSAAPADPTGLETAPTLRPRRLWVFGAVAALVLGLDILSKALVVAHLGEQHVPIRILGGAIYIDVTRNSGAAFSVGAGATILFTAVAVIVIAVILRVATRLRSVGWAISLGLILGGALGNLMDRLFRAPSFGTGHVVDWISLFGPNAAHWPIFNLADSAVCCGAVLAGILVLMGIDFDGRRKQNG